VIYYLSLVVMSAWIFAAWSLKTAVKLGIQSLVPQNTFSIPFISEFHINQEGLRPCPGLILLLAQKNGAKKRAISRVVQSAHDYVLRKSDLFGLCNESAVAGASGP
jgi:hypothetical protein